MKRKPKAKKGCVVIKVLTGYPDGTQIASYEQIPKVKYKVSVTRTQHINEVNALRVQNKLK